MIFTGETEVLTEKLLQNHIVLLKIDMDCFTCYFASLSANVCQNNEGVKGIFGSAFKFIISQFLWQQDFHENPTALRDSALHIHLHNDHKNRNYKKLMKTVSRKVEGPTPELYEMSGFEKLRQLLSTLTNVPEQRCQT